MEKTYQKQSGVQRSVNQFFSHGVGCKTVNSALIIFFSVHNISACLALGNCSPATLILTLRFIQINVQYQVHQVVII